MIAVVEQAKVFHAIPVLGGYVRKLGCYLAMCRVRTKKMFSKPAMCSILVIFTFRVNQGYVGRLQLPG